MTRKLYGQLTTGEQYIIGHPDTVLESALVHIKTDKPDLLFPDQMPVTVVNEKPTGEPDWKTVACKLHLALAHTEFGQKGYCFVCGNLVDTTGHTVKCVVGQALHAYAVAADDEANKPAIRRSDKVEEETTFEALPVGAYFKMIDQGKDGIVFTKLEDNHCIAPRELAGWCQSNMTVVQVPDPGERSRW